MITIRTVVSTAKSGELWRCNPLSSPFDCQILVRISSTSEIGRLRMRQNDRGGRELSNGRLGSEIGDIRGDSTPDIAGSIAKFSFVSRQIALYRGRRCQKWIAESEGYPMVSISQRLDNSTNLQLIRYRKMASRPQYYRYRVRTRIQIGRAYLIQQSITREGNEDRRRSGLEVISNNILLC